MCLERRGDLGKLKDLLANIGGVLWRVEGSHDIVGCGEE